VYRRPKIASVKNYKFGHFFMKNLRDVDRKYLKDVTVCARLRTSFDYGSTYTRKRDDTPVI
jgi:hypothetical protein